MNWLGRSAHNYLPPASHRHLTDRSVSQPVAYSCYPSNIVIRNNSVWVCGPSSTQLIIQFNDECSGCSTGLLFRIYAIGATFIRGGSSQQYSTYTLQAPILSRWAYQEEMLPRESISSSSNGFSMILLRSILSLGTVFPTRAILPVQGPAAVPSNSGTVWVLFGRHGSNAFFGLNFLCGSVLVRLRVLSSLMRCFSAS